MPQIDVDHQLSPEDTLALEQHNVGVSTNSRWIELGVEQYGLYINGLTESGGPVCRVYGRIGRHKKAKLLWHSWRIGNREYETLEEALSVGEKIAKDGIRRILNSARQIGLIT